MTALFNSEKLLAFAQAVGVDVKTLNEKVATLTNTVGSLPTNSDLNALKNEMLGGVGAEYDTLKEIADKLAELGSSEVSGAILEKFNELKQRWTALESVDLLQTYNTAKQGG